MSTNVRFRVCLGDRRDSVWVVRRGALNIIFRDCGKQWAACNILLTSVTMTVGDRARDAPISWQGSVGSRCARLLTAVITMYQRHIIHMSIQLDPLYMILYIAGASDPTQ